MTIRSRRAGAILPLLALPLLALPSVAGASGGERPEKVLDELLKIALRSSPAIAADAATAAGAGFEAAAADRLPDPRLGAGYSPVAIETRGGPQRARASVEQAFPFFGKRAARRDVAESAARIADHRTGGTASDVIASVKGLFWEVYRIDRSIEIAENEAALLEEIVSAAEARYETGAGSQANLLQAQLLETGVSNRLVLLRGARDGTVERLAGIAGAAIEVPSLGESPGRAVSLDPDALAEKAVGANPEAAAAVEGIRKARLALGLVRKDYFPDFALSAGWAEVGDNGADADFAGRDGWSLGAMLKIPLYRGEIGDRVKAARAALRAAEARRDDVTLRIRSGVADAVRRLRSIAESITLFRDGLLPQAESTFESAMASYATGGVSFADLMLAEKSLLDVELGYHETVARYESEKARLERLVGSKDEATLYPLRSDG